MCFEYTGNTIASESEQSLENPIQLPESAAKDPSHLREPPGASGTSSPSGIDDTICSSTQYESFPWWSLEHWPWLPVVRREHTGTTTDVAQLLEHPIKPPESLSREERSHPRDPPTASATSSPGVAGTSICDSMSMSYLFEQKLVLSWPWMVIDAWQDGQHGDAVQRSQVTMHD
jgi:hypothetical protein